jgi:hypothetical protein
MKEVITFADVMEEAERVKALKPRVLITLAETAEEALSDFTGYAQEAGIEIDERMFYTHEQYPTEVFGSDEVYNIISFDNEIPDNFDGWYAIGVVEWWEIRPKIFRDCEKMPCLDIA